TVDHNIPTKDQDQPIQDPASRHQVETLERNCRQHGIEYFGIGHPNQGIVHVIGPELGITRPGMTIVCGDSHTSTHGALGAIAFGIGTSQVEQVLATQCLVIRRPKTMRIWIENALLPGVSAKDVALYTIAQLGMEGATGHFVEYAGPVIEQLSIEGRMTIANMSIEMGARGGCMGIDAQTISYLRDRIEVSAEQEATWRSLNSDAGAIFDQEIRLDGSKIRPIVTVGTSPDTGIEIRKKINAAPRLSPKAGAYTGFDPNAYVNEQRIDYVFIGSCTNGRIEDLRAVAEIVSGKKKAEGVEVWVVPGSQRVKAQAIREGIDQVLTQAGFEFRDPGCSACLSMNNDKIPNGAVCVSTSNRNFEGRQGPGAVTILASPQTAAVSALTGKVTDPTHFLAHA
ncbi:MAG: 3-isopropylmalate dehydratase large subunit, partial [Bacteroidota bacterium]